VRNCICIPVGSYYSSIIKRTLHVWHYAMKVEGGYFKNSAVATICPGGIVADAHTQNGESWTSTLMGSQLRTGARAAVKGGS
jgi:hypothetical protein